MSKDDKKLNAKHQVRRDRGFGGRNSVPTRCVRRGSMQDILNAMLSEEENKVCADCYDRSPRWASWNLGVFICIKVPFVTMVMCARA
jgi:hypothetical protein